MWRSSVTTAVIGVAVCLLMVASAIAQQTEGNAVNSSSGYPDSPEGLKAFLDDVFGALKTDDKAKMSALSTTWQSLITRRGS
jgi:hypothetical protein